MCFNDKKLCNISRVGGSCLVRFSLQDCRLVIYEFSFAFHVGLRCRPVSNGHLHFLVVSLLSAVYYCFFHCQITIKQVPAVQRPPPPTPATNIALMYNFNYTPRLESVDLNILHTQSRHTEPSFPSTASYIDFCCKFDCPPSFLSRYPLPTAVQYSIPLQLFLLQQ